MQPPQFDGLFPRPYRTYINKLDKMVEEGLKKSGTSKRPTNSEYLPLEKQISRWWINLPPSVRQRKFQIAEIAAQCSGRYCERPALRKVAEALRSMGWHEVRDWTIHGRNRRLWNPPSRFINSQLATTG